MAEKAYKAFWSGLRSGQPASGALPASSLPEEVTQRIGPQASQFLLIDALALKASEEVRALAASNTPVIGGDAGVRGGGVGRGAHRLCGAAPARSRKLALVGEGFNQGMLPVVGLLALAA